MTMTMRMSRAATRKGHNPTQSGRQRVTSRKPSQPPSSTLKHKAILLLHGMHTATQQPSNSSSIVRSMRQLVLATSPRGNNKNHEQKLLKVKNNKREGAPSQIKANKWLSAGRTNDAWKDRQRDQHRGGRATNKQPEGTAKTQEQ